MKDMTRNTEEYKNNNKYRWVTKPVESGTKNFHVIKVQHFAVLNKRIDQNCWK